MTVIYNDIREIPKLIDHDDIFNQMNCARFVNQQKGEPHLFGKSEFGQEGSFDQNLSKLRAIVQFVRVVDDDEYELGDFDGYVLEFQNYHGFNQRADISKSNESDKRRYAYFFINRALYHTFFVNKNYNLRVQPGNIVDMWCVPQYLSRKTDKKTVFIYSVSLMSVITSQCDIDYLISLFSKELKG